MPFNINANEEIEHKLTEKELMAKEHLEDMFDITRNLRVSSITKNAGKACNNRLYRHIRTFEKIIKNYFVI